MNDESFDAPNYQPMSPPTQARRRHRCHRNRPPIPYNRLFRINPRCRLSAGTRLGPYESLTFLGAGGQAGTHGRCADRVEALKRRLPGGK
jgi:hypothetical protein